MDLFDQQEYVAVQEALRALNRDELSDDQKAEFDRLQQVLSQAIAADAMAERNLAQADEALKAERWDEAEALYQAVLDSTFARKTLKEKAGTTRTAGRVEKSAIGAGRRADRRR